MERGVLVILLTDIRGQEPALGELHQGKLIIT